jgi:integrase
MGSKRVAKNPRGSVSIEKDRNRIRLRWRYQATRYALNLFVHNKYNLLQAKKIAVQIEQDMVSGGFDRTLDKYRVNHLAKSPGEKTIVDLFVQWVSDYKNMDCDVHKNYHTVRAMIRRWGNIDVNTIGKKLALEPLNEKNYNRRLTTLKNFLGWMVKNKHCSHNPLEDIERRKVKKTVNSKRLPFKEKEIEQILTAIKDDKFCSVGVRFKHSHYYPFIYFLFRTGVRNAEAVGLRIGHIQMDDNYILIKEVLARSMSSSNASVRIRKETKNGKVRMIPLTEDLVSILQPLMIGKDSDDLVFQSHTGKGLDDKMFQRRVFKPVLKALKIADRNLYACRHTFASKCIQSGLTPVATAFLLGNNPETALRTYTHMLEVPKGLPDMY